MARPYLREMAQLSDTLRWALSADLSPLSAAVQDAKTGPLVAVGSGGSLSAAHALAHLHRSTTGHLATVLTPYEVATTALQRSSAVWLLSASGNNVDIVNAGRAVVAREPRQLVALAGRAESKLADLLGAHRYADVITYPPPTGKDGFLATNSLLGFATLLARAYANDEWSSDDVAYLLAAADPASELVRRWRQEAEPLWGRDTTVVLYGASTALGAVDLESKFTEAALGHAQIADYRNFAHGRHHWIAKHQGTTGVIAFVSDEDVGIADRTLELLPRDVPIARFELPGRSRAASLAALLVAFHLTGWAGQARTIDPGDPGVPQFGRKLFHLSPPRRRVVRPPGVTPRAAAAIERKAGSPIDQLEAAGSLTAWKLAHDSFRRSFSRVDFTGVVLDYDGTVVDTRDRYDPPHADVVNELVRLLRGGVAVGVATGRGQSVRRELSAVLPAELHGRVVVGYYNGGDVSDLRNLATPRTDFPPDAALTAVEQDLAAHPDLAGRATLDPRPHQLTVTWDTGCDETRLWRIVEGVVGQHASGLRVTRSSHSVDIVTARACKLNVVNRVLDLNPGGAVTIGDRGHAPGNDHELLSTSWSLSVDECSPMPDRCWNLGAPGQRGAAITVEYLRALVLTGDGRATFNMAGLR